MISAPKPRATTSKGVLYAILGSFFWGVSGTVAQYGFSVLHFDAIWVVSIRLFFAGMALTVWKLLSHNSDVWLIWHNRQDLTLLLLFTFLGMMPSQLTYFLAIRYSNAATATVLQFLSPFVIIVALSLMTRKLPTHIQFVSLLLALFGTFLVVTGGNWNTMTLSLLGVLWGLASAGAAAAYTVLPVRLIKKYDPALVVGWSMLLGSIPFLPVMFISAPAHLSFIGILVLSCIVVIGTVGSYTLYLTSIRYIPTISVGMIASIQPLTTAVISVIFLGTRLSGFAIFGGVMILFATCLQSLPKKSNEVHDDG